MRIFLELFSKNLLPTATAVSINMAKKLTSGDPAKRPPLNDFVAALDMQA